MDRRNHRWPFLSVAAGAAAVAAVALLRRSRQHRLTLARRVCPLNQEAVAPDLPIGWITLSRPWPLRAAQVLGPLWPLLLLNPFYVRLAHRKGQLVCPLDPNPGPRLRLYLHLGCDAVLSDDPGATSSALQRLAGREEQS